MNDAFDDLEVQLRRGARAIGGPGAARARRGGKRTLALAIAAVLAISAGALAATRIGGGRSAETQGRELALQAARDTAQLPVCNKLNESSDQLTFTNVPPLAEITALLPALARPVPSSSYTSALALLPRFAADDGPLLRQTLRTVTLQEGIRLLVFVQQGVGIEAVRDPLGCGRTRIARALLLSRDRPPAVRKWALWRLAQMRDTVPGLQTLYLFELDPHQPGGGGGAEAAQSGHPLRPGLRSVMGGRDGSRLFVGITGPRAAQVIVKTRSAAMHGHRRRVPVVQRFYAVRLPKGVGPFRLLEATADGTALHSIDLRQ
jgi:hypothetical protein